MAGMLQARRLDGYDDDATVDGAALLHDESEKPLLTSMMHLGRWPLEVAPTVCVQLFDKRRIRCWRTDKVEGLAPRPDGDIEADGVITATRIEKSRVDRAYSVSDVTLTVNGTQLKLWLPRRACLRRRWEALLRNDIFSRSKKRLAIEQRVAAAAEAFATGGPPPGHTRHRDAETGRDYDVDEKGATTWVNNEVVKTQPPSSNALALAWLLQRALGDEVDAVFSGEGDAPVLRGALAEMKRCPLVPEEAVDAGLQEIPKLLKKAEAVAGSSNEEDGARHHLVQFVARPVFYLATREAVGDDASLEAALRKACGSAADALSNGKFTALEALRSGSSIDELPEELRVVIAAARPLLLRRVGRTLTPRTDALRNSQKAYDAVPRHTLATALRAGVVPNSSSFVGGLAELMARRKLTRGGSETVAQALARARLGLDSLPDDLKDTPEHELGEDHAAQVEVYRRRAEALVEAYGDDAYADFVCNTYPALFEPLASIITASEVKAADALDELFGAWGDALAAAEDPMVTDSDRAFVWDDCVGRILDALVAVAHRAAEADVDTWRALGAWLERFVDRLRLDLAVDLEDVSEDTAKLAAAHASSAGDFAALAACDCPALEAALPGFVEALRTEWAAREPSAAPRVVAAPAEAPEKPSNFFSGLFSRGKGS